MSRRVKMEKGVPTRTKGDTTTKEGESPQTVRSQGGGNRGCRCRDGNRDGDGDGNGNGNGDRGGGRAEEDS